MQPATTAAPSTQPATTAVPTAQPATTVAPTTHPATTAAPTAQPASIPPAGGACVRETDCAVSLWCNDARAGARAGDDARAFADAKCGRVPQHLLRLPRH